MSTSRTKLVVLAVAAAATLGALRLARHVGSGGAAEDHATTADESQLDGRVWVEARPDKLTDYVHSAFFFSRANFGVFERASAYDLRMEFCDLSKKDGKLKLFFPQTKKSAETTFTVKDCSDKAPFDLCLDIADNPWGGPKRYYGFAREEDERAALGETAVRLRAKQPR
jgi:hypothetical protein